MIDLQLLQEALPLKKQTTEVVSTKDRKPEKVIHD